MDELSSSPLGVSIASGEGGNELPLSNPLDKLQPSADAASVTQHVGHFRRDFLGKAAQMEAMDGALNVIEHAFELHVAILPDGIAPARVTVDGHAQTSRIDDGETADAAQKWFVSMPEEKPLFFVGQIP